MLNIPIYSKHHNFNKVRVSVGGFTGLSLPTVLCVFPGIGYIYKYTAYQEILGSLGIDSGSTIYGLGDVTSN